MRTIFIILSAIFFASACKPALLPGTRVEDTRDNRVVIGFLADYKKAIESRSADQVLALVAEDYWEDNGTVEQEDDYGIQKLKADLEKELSVAKVIHLQMHVQRIEELDDKLVVDYRYHQRALLGLPSQEKWVSHTDVNRIVLRKTGDKLEDGLVIVSGL